MQGQQRGGAFRRFVQTPAGSASLTAVAVLATFGTYVYISPLLAIVAVLAFGLAVPIWAGLKRPRYLALSGVVIVLLVAPLASAVFTQEIRTPIPVVSSNTEATGGVVLTNAQVSPYTGTTSTNFTWTVTIEPQWIPKANGTPVNITLFISTCPGATGTNSTNCPAGYPFTALVKTLPSGLTTTTTVSWNYTIGQNGIWDWQMGLWSRNTTSGVREYIQLQGDPTYNGIEGPVVGSWWVTYGEIVPTLYFNVGLLIGLPFFIALLLYIVFKRRERQRREDRQRAAGNLPPDAGPGGSLPRGSTGGPPPSGPAASSSASESNCPNCNAVVYAGEATCWKCGASLGGAATPSLPSAPKG